jgi:hypothetical protein
MVCVNRRFHAAVILTVVATPCVSGLVVCKPLGAKRRVIALDGPVSAWRSTVHRSFAVKPKDAPREPPRVRALVSIPKPTSITAAVVTESVPPTKPVMRVFALVRMGAPNAAGLAWIPKTTANIAVVAEKSVRRNKSVTRVYVLVRAD